MLAKKWLVPASGVKSAGPRTSRDGTPWESLPRFETARVLELQTLLTQLTASELRDTPPALLLLAIADSVFLVEDFRLWKLPFPPCTESYVN
jgi:hypothetical protein